MSGVPVVPGEGFASLRDMTSVQVTFFISQEHQYALYIVEAIPAAVLEDMEPELMAVLDEDVEAV